MLERIRGWMEQSMARSSPDGAAHYLAAEIAIVRKDAAEAARQLAMSRQNGVPPGAVKALLDRASDEGVTNAALDGLRQSIEQELAPASPPTAQPRDDAGETHAP